jgi:hypothetical protein
MVTDLMPVAKSTASIRGGTMHTSAAKFLNQVGQEIESLREQKKPEQQLAIYSNSPIGWLRVHHLKAVSEELIVLIGLDYEERETHICLAASTLQLAMRLEPKEKGREEKKIAIDGFNPKGAGAMVKKLGVRS